jgi:hypothetical protein
MHLVLIKNKEQSGISHSGRFDMIKFFNKYVVNGLMSAWVLLNYNYYYQLN